MASSQRPRTTTVSTCTPETAQGTHVFNIAAYSLHKGLGIGEFIRSTTFAVGGYDWCIRYYPDGADAEEGKEYFSVYLELLTKDAEVRAHYRFCLAFPLNAPLSVFSSMKPAVFNSVTTPISGPRKFKKRYELETALAILRQDSITIVCDVTVVKETRVEDTTVQVQVPPSDLSDNLRKLPEAKEGADVTFKVEGDAFPAHKIVLAMRSPVFKAQLYGSMRDKRRNITVKAVLLIESSLFVPDPKGIIRLVVSSVRFVLRCIIVLRQLFTTGCILLNHRSFHSVVPALPLYIIVADFHSALITDVTMTSRCKRQRGDHFCPLISSFEAANNRKKRRLSNLQRAAARTGSTSLFSSNPFTQPSISFSKEYVSYLKATYNDRSYYGGPDYECNRCGAIFWFQERSQHRSSSKHQRIIYNKCCRGGKVSLPPHKQFPYPLQDLIGFNKSPQSNEFMRLIRQYNSLFAFTSLGVDIDRTINDGGGPYVFRINGVVHHRIGSLIPTPGRKPQYAQLYIYDTYNEIQNRLSLFNKADDTHDEADSSIIAALIIMLDYFNPLVNQFRMARDRLFSEENPEVHIRLIGSSDSHDDRYSLPTVPELAALIVGDLSSENNTFDIIVETHAGELKRISPLNPALMSLQYPLLFPHGEKGFHLGIKYKSTDDSLPPVRDQVSMLEYYCYQCHYRRYEPNPYTCCGRLSNQIEVDCYSCLEANRLSFHFFNQDVLRSDTYQGISDALGEGTSEGRNIGVRILLPSSFTGSRRYNTLNYQDAMAICREYGPPDLFSTFTCNSRWPEIIDALKHEPGQSYVDRSDIVTRVFHMKLTEYISDIKSGHTFGIIQAVLYTIEFQKRGLPHVHTLIWLADRPINMTPQFIDTLISAEIPDPVIDPLGYALVEEFMMHGPCGNLNRKCPCMKNGVCSKRYPKQFNPETVINEFGFPVYRRRDTNHFIIKNGIKLDNRWVVPYNMDLLKKFQAHINVEWCNKTNLVKYLFKYLIKGQDRAKINFSTVDQASGTADTQVKQGIDEIADYIRCSLHMAYTLSYINQTSHKWKVLVRLPRVWEFRNPQNTADVYRLDFIMLDEQGNVMEGLVPQRWLDKFATLLKEGSIYEIEYFEVLPAKETYKSVDGNNLARFSKYTKVKEILPEPDGFPVYAYSAVPFSILNERIGKNALLSDTVVLITAASQVIQTTTKLGPTVKRTINITDGSQTAIITLWGHHAELFNAEMLLTVSQDTPVIALFVGMLVGTYSGQLALQSSSASKWYINIPIPEINALRNTISTRPHQIEWHEDNHGHNNPITTTVHELMELIPNEALGQRYKVDILITDLVMTHPWWYIACSSCWKKTFPHGDEYECRRCGAKTAEPRYKINVYGVDPGNSEDSKPIHAEFMFFGDIGQQLVGRPAMLLVAATEGQTQHIPPEIKAVIGQRYQLIVQMSEGSLQAENPTFHVRSFTAQPDHSNLLLPGPSVTTICAETTTPATPTTTLQIIPSPHSEKRPHECITPTETELASSSIPSNKRTIQPADKAKVARQLFPDPKDHPLHKEN